MFDYAYFYKIENLHNQTIKKMNLRQGVKIAKVGSFIPRQDLEIMNTTVQIPFAQKYAKGIARTQKVLKMTGLLFTVPHLLIMFVAASIVSTALLTIGMYIMISWVLIYVIKRIALPQGLIIAVVVFSILMLGIDLWLRTKIDYQGYVEKNGGYAYYSNYKFHNLFTPAYEPNAEPNSVNTEEKPEFTYTHNYNNMGYKGPNIVSKKKGEYRIAMLGDSWTEGIGTPDDSSGPALLQKKLDALYPSSHINVLNFGKSGSDPVYALHMLKTNFIDFKPDMVVLNINGSDVNDIISRGGMERYHSDGSLHLRAGPWWEFFYGYSFIVRAFVHNIGYDRQLRKKVIPPQGLVLPRDSAKVNEFEEYFKTHDEHYLAAIKLAETVEAMAAYCKAKNIKFVADIIPGQYEMQDVSINWEGKKVFGLHDGLYFTYDRLMQQQDFPVIFLSPLYWQHGITAESAWTYYWQKDYHHRSDGYNVYAQCMAEQLKFP